MASTNIYRNITTLSLAVEGGGTIDTFTSIIGLSINDATTYEKDGADNDTSYTFTEQGPLEGRGSIIFRDANQAARLRNQKGVLTWTEKAAKGSDVNMKALAVAFGQSGDSGRWKELRAFELPFECGAFGLAADIS